MRTVPLVASAVIGGAAVGLALFMVNLVDIRVEIQREPTGGPPTPPQSTYNSESSSPSTSAVEDQGFVANPNTPRQLVESANKRASAGEFSKAQEFYLQVLSINPDDQTAMQGLVRVRRLMAGNNAAALRKQAATYRRAITQGKETGEHYTAAAMDLLAVASLQAAVELEGSRAKSRPTVITLTPKPPPTPRAEAQQPRSQRASARPQPKSESKPKEVIRSSEAQPQAPAQAPVAPRPVAKPPSPPPAPPPSTVEAKPPVTPKPVGKPPSPPPPPAPLTVEAESPVDMNEPFMTITIGPIASRTQASNIATDLTVAGYVARMRWSGAEYQITLGPYRRSIAEKIASRIRSRVKQGIPVSLNPSTN